MEDNKSMVSVMAAHMSDAGRMLRANKAPAITTVRGLMEAVRWLDKQRRLALERLNDAEGRLFAVAGETVVAPMSLIDTLIEYESWCQVAPDGKNYETLEQKARGFIAAYADSFPGRRLPGLPPVPHKPEEELDG